MATEEKKVATEEKKILSPEEQEQQEAQQIAYFEEQAIALRFMTRHPEYKPCIENSTRLRDLLLENGMQEMTEGGLESAFLAHRDKFELNPEPVQAPPVVEKKVEEEIELPPWGILTKSSIHSIPKEQYRKWLRNPDFENQVNRVLRQENQFDIR